MALSSANATEARSFSVGPLKMQLKTLTIASGDTSGTITFDSLDSIDFVIVGGLVQTAAPTFAGNVATVAFADPLATRHGQIVAYGK